MGGGVQGVWKAPSMHLGTVHPWHRAWHAGTRPLGAPMQGTQGEGQGAPLSGTFQLHPG